MRFASTGKTNSMLEAQAVGESVKESGAECRERFIYFIQALNSLNERGYAAERGKWIRTEDARVVVYTGDPEGSQCSGSRLRLWAAVELGEDGKPLTLLKIADGYRGREVDYANYLTEAFDRLKGGRI